MELMEWLMKRERWRKEKRKERERKGISQTYVLLF